jgi:outer membrane protein OmpA-like peptidoglycan-associated protein
MKLHRLSPITRAVAPALLALVTLGACTTVPPNNAKLDQARSSYRAAQGSPKVAELAGVELKQAGDALNLAEQAWTRKDNSTEVDHLAYLAQQRVTIAEEIASRKTSEQAVTAATAARDQVRLAARTRQAETAQMQAQSAQRDATQAQRQAELSRQQADASKRQADVSTQQADAAKQQSQDAQRQAMAAQQQSAQSQQQTRDAELRASQLQAQLEAQMKEMNAKNTERGMVVTLGDVLFDTNQAQLKPGAARNVDKLVAFLKQYPDRKAMIEGFTDSVGGDSSNQVLSARRADAVRAALVAAGVGADRLVTQGFGEAYPVAGNDSAGGRQMNRRVEIVLSNETGKIMPR